MRAAIQNHVDRNPPLLDRNATTERKELSDITVYVPGEITKSGCQTYTLFELSFFVPLSPGAGRVTYLIINHDYLLKASPN